MSPRCETFQQRYLFHILQPSFVIFLRFFCTVHCVLVNRVTLGMVGQQEWAVQANNPLKYIYSHEATLAVQKPGIFNFSMRTASLPWYIITSAIITVMTAPKHKDSEKTH